MSFYIYIAAQQAPFDFGFDTSNRHQISCNYLATIRGTTATFAEEIAQRLDDEGIGTRNTDIFIGRMITLPNGDGPYTRVINTPGIAPKTTHDDKTVQTLGLQIITIGKPGNTAYTKALDTFTALHNVANTTLNDT